MTTDSLWCYIDGCGKPATYVVHSYPDTVRLCDGHKSLQGRLEPFETRCTGAGCSLCPDD
jgi:hypothetical protein